MSFFASFGLQSGSTTIRSGVAPQLALELQAPGKNRSSTKLHHGSSLVSRQPFHVSKPFLEISLPRWALWAVIERSATTSHSRSFFVTRFACRSWLVPSQLPVLQSDHPSTKAQISSLRRAPSPISLSHFEQHIGTANQIPIRGGLWR